VALVQEACGASPLASLAVNCMAPDEGTMHVLLDHGTDDQKERYLRPLAEARIRSCFAMTERDVAGSDPTTMRTRAVRDGDEWVIDGEKWFISGARGAAFAVVMAVTDHDAAPHDRCTVFIVDADDPGWSVVREIPVMGTDLPGGHCEVRLDGCRVADEAILGGRGRGFAVGQSRLAFGRLGHAMRWIGMAQRALDLAAGRALDRQAFGHRLADHQAVQWWLADSAMQLYASRLMVLHAAWKLEQGVDVRQEIGFVKVFVSEALGDIVDRALQVHGSLGYSGDTPLEGFYRDARAARIYDGPSEVHRMVLARNLLRAMSEEGTTRRATGGLT
jgi:acyl-CoA dehydrogenase